MLIKKKKYIFFPKLDSKHLLFLFFILFAFAKKFIQYYLETSKSLGLEFFKLYVFDFGDLLSIIPFLIIKKRSKLKNKNTKEENQGNINSEGTTEYLIYNPIENSKKNDKKGFIYVLLTTILDFIAQISRVIFHIIKEQKKLDVKESYLNSLLAINMIITILFSKFMLHTDFYRHHSFAFLLNILCLLALSVIDIIETIDEHGDNIIMTIVYFLIILLSKALYSFEDVLVKVIFLFYYYSPYALLLTKSIFHFFYLILFSFPFIFIELKDEKNENKLIFSMIGDIFEDKLYILVEILFSILSFFYNIITFKIIDAFSPNHFIIARVGENFCIYIINIILTGADKEKYIIFKIILFILLILISFIYNEFIVINICGLSKNTKLFLEYEEKNELAIIKINYNGDDDIDDSGNLDNGRSSSEPKIDSKEFTENNNN